MDPKERADYLNTLSPSDLEKLSPMMTSIELEVQTDVN